MKKKILIYIFLFFLPCIINCQSNQKKENLECNIDKQSRLEIRLGGNERLSLANSIAEVLPLYGFSPSINLFLPIKLGEKHYLFTKLSFGGSVNNVHFNDLSSGIAQRRIGNNGTDLYSNIYAGVGIGKYFTKELKNKSFLKLSISLNTVFFPFVETFSDEGFTSIPFRDYSVDIENNLNDKTNFSLVPEASLEYHFSLYGCKSFSIGVYYSRGFNEAYNGSVAIQRANGEELRESFSKPFNSFGLSFGYGIFRTKK